MTTDFGRRLKRARKHAGLTQKQLAPLVGMSQSNLSELETVAHESRKTVLLAHACKVDAYWLATGDGDMLPTESSQSAAVQVPQPPTLDQALDRLGIELAQDMSTEHRAELADALAAWAKYKGREAYRATLAGLLASPHALPEKRQSNGR